LDWTAVFTDNPLIRFVSLGGKYIFIAITCLYLVKAITWLCGNASRMEEFVREFGFSIYAFLVCMPSILDNWSRRSRKARARAERKKDVEAQHEEEKEKLLDSRSSSQPDGAQNPTTSSGDIVLSELSITNEQPKRNNVEGGNDDKTAPTAPQEVGAINPPDSAYLFLQDQVRVLQVQIEDLDNNKLC
jgi:hypothetical protein